MSSNVILKLVDVRKVFPGVVANDDVNLEVREGEIHAIVGENGAGKSTLMNIIFGLYHQDGGEIYYKGEPYNVSGPNDAIKLGIGMVHQHFMLVEPFTVVENIILGSEPTTNGVLDIKTATKKVKEISDRYKLMIKPDEVIENISVGMQQRVEILKTLFRGAELLIFDEPTAVLTPQEIEELFEIFRTLKKQGKTIIFITHKLKEVKAISDRITVLRQGKTIGTVNTDEVNENDIAKMMVGREVLLRVEKKEGNPGDVILEVEDLCANDNRGLPALKNISFSIRKGEILGFAGVEGNGQSELVEVLTGLRKATKGKITYKGQDITNQSPRTIKESGVGHIPEDRHKRGSILDYNIAENLILGFHHKPPFAKPFYLDYKAIKANADKLIPEFDVRTPSADVKIRSLSGGNQQKVIIAREISQQPDLLIASQPTRGVDIGAIEFIHKRIIEQRDQGKAVLLVSAELQEVMSLSDRIAVIYDGEIVGIVDAKNIDEFELGAMMTGSTLKKEGVTDEK
ncbi:ABC transporter ATP-binding protein [Anaerobranca gottschalkii]|uniref:Nucleoside ABC transporter ATP-binding protein n=1 Tax=Anaerobranca gottschalkii DSM 13577 TaxID=1120990 RepID=A0A1H9Z892_9FIRM|nr:ABC transporter ATP-binding protein [Anaerobranca gottschalkii]SES77729.1 nucleoside ABC transporter ATP-binding protein [Anaerobranca gottschalkii DSM 13577]